MENMIGLHITGFVICFVLLFVFVAKYREVLAQEQSFDSEMDDLTVVTVGKEPIYKPRASLLQSVQSGSALDVADLKEQVRALHYQLAELKSSSNKTNGDVAKQLVRMEQRLTTFEQEYVNKLQPTLLRVIEELEHIKGTETPDSSEK